MNSKRLISILLSICIMLTVASFPVMAATGTTDDGLKYAIAGGKVTVIGYTGTATEVVIPSSIEGYPVTKIGSNAFEYCTFKSITIPDSVTSIGEYAFYDCSSLTSIIIPDSVTSIGDYAFSRCDSLTSVTIPDSVTKIGGFAFFGCTSLTSITIPDSVTSIGDRAFGWCTSLTSITIPDSVTSIGSGAFSDCTSLTSVTIPDSVTWIGDYAFDYCSYLQSVYITDIGAWCEIVFSNYASNPLYYADNLYLNGELVTELVIPDSVTWIGNYAFRYCSSLASITIPDSVTRIGNRAFQYCTSLTSITIPDSVTKIGDYAFYGCTSLTSVTIPDSVTWIGDYVFYGCESLESVTLPVSVTMIYGYAFESCYSLNDVYYAGTQAQKEQITIGSNNSYLTDATWHYETALVCDHVFDNACDSECNKCGTSRTVAHSYDNACDAECNLCKAIREVGNHKYDSVCDADCNECGAKRAVTHTYINACDLDCNVCGHVRPVNNHVYDNRCDADCNVCGAIQKVGNHYYTNDADNTCDECGYTRGNADNAPAFIIEDRIAKVGDTFTVAVSTKNNSGIVSFKLKVGYNTEVLELVSIEEGDFADTTFGAVTNNPISVLWEDVLSDNNTTNGTVALLTFKVKDTAKACDTEITITYDPEDVYDYDMNNVDFAVENGTITVIEYISGDVNGDGNVNNKDYGILRQYLNNWEVNIDERAADVNRDGKVNNKDLGILRRYLNNWDVELL